MVQPIRSRLHTRTSTSEQRANAARYQEISSWCNQSDLDYTHAQAQANNELLLHDIKRYQVGVTNQISITHTYTHAQPSEQANAFSSSSTKASMAFLLPLPLIPSLPAHNNNRIAHSLISLLSYLSLPSFRVLVPRIDSPRVRL